MCELLETKMSASDHPAEDTLKILIASDIHLGYMEKDSLRGEDSFIAFEEILSIAKMQKVDLILLGGDLFHDSKPSPKCLHRCMSLIRKYCMGDSPVSVQFLSDQSENFKHCENPVVNYEDPNFNISIPIFSIHGNHDDTSGFGALSALDLLSAPGLVNYFGKWEDCTSVEISPLLMCKGETYFALYGLSHLKDDRLARLFLDHNIELLVPDEHHSKWFNTLMLHQNRVDRGPKSFVTEEMLPPFLDLIIWGHEHECRIEPEYNANHNFYVCQPGSSVATSLCEGESVQKHVATLSIYKKEFKIKPIRLNTVRPFIFGSLVLADCSIDLDGKFAPLKVQDYVNERVEQLIDETASQISGDSRQPIIPLIRLRVEYYDEKHMFNPIQFGLQFSGKVANPKDVVIFRKQRQTAEKGSRNSIRFDDDMDILKGIVNAEDQPGSIEKTMNKLIDRYFEQFTPHTDLRILSIKALQEVASRFTNANDTEALDIYTEYKRKELKKYLLKNCSNVSDIGNQILKFRKETLATAGHEEIDAASTSIEKHRPNEAVINILDSDEDTDTEISFVPEVNSRRKGQVASTSRGRLTTGKGRAASTSRGKVTTGPRTRKGKVSDSDEDTDTEMSFEPEDSHRGKGRAASTSRGRARRATTRGRGQKQPALQQSIIQAFSQQSITSARKGVVYDSDSSIEFPYPSD